jgi:hypothetical protein
LSPVQPIYPTTNSSTANDVGVFSLSAIESIRSTYTSNNRVGLYADISGVIAIRMTWVNESIESIESTLRFDKFIGYKLLAFSSRIQILKKKPGSINNEVLRPRPGRLNLLRNHVIFTQDQEASKVNICVL